MSKQLIISISREFGSGGHDIARKLSEDLGLKLYDRKILDDIASEKNINVEVLEKFDERPRRIMNSRRVGAYSNSMEEILADMQFEYIREKANSGGSFIVVGRCAETVLKDHEGLVSIFVLADKEWKMGRVMKKYSLNEEEAVIKMARHDRKRKKYHNRHSDFKWGDSRNYDLCINSTRLGIEKTAILIKEFVEESQKENK